jgi:hypothetical protein
LVQIAIAIVSNEGKTERKRKTTDQEQDVSKWWNWARIDCGKSVKYKRKRKLTTRLLLWGVQGLIAVAAALWDSCS